MKAIAIQRFGGSEELVKRGLPQPEPAEDEVVIRVVAAGVSQLDRTACRGETRGTIAVTFPWIPGFEVAGVVEQLGPACRRFRVGDRVCALLPAGGGYAQFVAVGEDHVAPMPASLLFEEAATLPLDGSAAWNALSCCRKPAAGSGTVLIRGASSGAGHLAVQIALGVGARVIVDAPPDHREFVEKLGRIEWMDPKNPPAADLKIDAGVPANDEPGWIEIGGGGGSEQALGLQSAEPFHAAAGLATMVEQRRLRPRLYKILNIEKALEIHSDLESTATTGKIALTF